MLPLALLPTLRAADAPDVHHVTTLVDRDGRAGRYVEFDRIGYLDRGADEAGGGGDALVTWAGEALAVDGGGDGLDRPATVSIRARFVDAAAVEVLGVHVHPPGLRDLASYIGLALVLAYWLRALRAPLGAAERRACAAARRAPR